MDVLDRFSFSATPLSSGLVKQSENTMSIQCNYQILYIAGSVYF